jgi:cytochrome c oxidase cbb3-type subunit 3
MSDFNSGFWSWYIGIISVGGIFWCLWLVWWMSSGASTKTGDEVETSGHVWDEDLEEFNNPLPAWWKNMFYITIVFGLVYLILYPGIGSFKGVLGWTAHKQLAEEEQAAKEKFGPIYAKYATQSIEALGSDDAALKIGKRLFLTYCTACHGSDAGGVTGFPNLRDNDWLYGGTPAQIKASIMNGRNGVMPSWEAPLGGAQGVHEVTQYVLSLSKRPGIDENAAAAGQARFATLCAGCHLPTGTGLQALGAPNLTDNIWLYGGHEKAIAETISKGRKGHMPAHGEFLGEEKVHLLTAYIYRLSQ